jgi:hypothetical protein
VNAIDLVRIEVKERKMCNEIVKCGDRLGAPASTGGYRL